MNNSLLKFLFVLRSIMRTSYAVCLITVPTHVFQVFICLLTCFILLCLINKDTYLGERVLEYA